MVVASRKRKVAATETVEGSDTASKQLKSTVEAKHCSRGNKCEERNLPQPLPVANFSKDNSNKRDGLQSTCRKCASADDRRYRESEHGFLRNMLNAAKNSTKRRNDKGRNMECTLTIEQLKSKLEQQQCRCAITGHLMNLKPHSDWACSLERLDNSIGYTDANTVLIISEMNTPKQWTPVKLAYLFSYAKFEPVQFTDEQLQPNVRTKERKGSRRSWTENADGTVFCHDCGNTKEVTEFNTQLANGCKICRAVRNDAKRNTWYGALQRMFHSAKASSKKRSMSFDISLEQFIDIFRQQGGLCSYSGKPMTLSGDFQASPERLDTLISYTVANLVFACQEFNSADRTRQKTAGSNDGSAGWSRSKYDFMQSFVHGQK